MDKAQFPSRRSFLIDTGGDEFSLSRSMTIATGDILPLDDEGQQVWPKAGDRAEFVLLDASGSVEVFYIDTSRSETCRKEDPVHGQVGQA